MHNVQTIHVKNHDYEQHIKTSQARTIQTITIKNHAGGASYDEYKGSYDVTPDAHNAVVLETKDKLMMDDVTVFKIPVWEVSNPQNGQTIYIGENNIYGY